MEAIDVGAEEESSPVEKHRVQRKEGIWLCAGSWNVFTPKVTRF